MCVFHEPPYQISLAEYEDLATGGPAGARWLDSTRKFLHLARDFVLVKGGEVRADSRTGTGPRMRDPAGRVARSGALWSTHHDRPDRDEHRTCLVAAVGCAARRCLAGRTSVQQSGDALELRCGTCGAYRARRGRWHRNEAASCRLTLPGLDSGRYRIEIDCVAERVAWFAQAGSPPAVVTLDIIPK